ncbi:MAG TPA: STAS domain-containing protein [bacterium]|nr:STAS domain-containing protein [bacterium]HPN30294.1 STAS domain-containing protein [bacterium]
MDITKEIKNNVGILKIFGDTSIHIERKLNELVKSVGPKTQYRFILDLSQCAYIDSGAIGSIILTNKLISDMNGKFCICGVQDENVDKLFNSTKLYNLIPKFENVEEAFENFFS